MSENKRPVGRPAVNATAITLRVPPELLRGLDAFVVDQLDTPSRPEAIRRLLRDAMIGLGYLKADQ